MASSLNVDECIETLKSGECVSERSLRLLCAYVSELLMEESNVQPVLSPVTIVGDLHGQFFDLLHLLKVGGWPPDTCYIFLGDFVDRGHNSVETLSLLLCLKLKYPGHITLLRGNHEVILAQEIYIHVHVLPFLTHFRDIESSNYAGIWILR
jgi:serine/threonine-protein phosphatase 6 catalytic subunit